MPAEHTYSFRSPLGPVALIWTNDGIRKIILEFDGAISRKPMSPDWVHHAASDIVAYMSGERIPRGPYRLDWSALSDFSVRVYRALQKSFCPQTYGELAERVGSPLAARAIGRCMSQNPFPILVPCHLVVGANGALGGFSAPSGIELKKALLRIHETISNRRQ